jgi:subtilase family serine protease
MSGLMPRISRSMLGLAACLVLTSGAALAQTKPDLVVTSLTDPPATAIPGDAFSVTAIVTNQGGDSAISTSTKFLLVKVNTGTRKNLKGLQVVGALAPGASDGPTTTVVVYSDTVPGSYYLRACADGLSQVGEASEANNCTTTTATITVLDVPDLVVSSISDPPAKATVGQSVAITDTVQNIGAVSAVATTTKYYLVSTSNGLRIDLKGTQSVPALGSSEAFTEQETLTIRLETIPDTYLVQACADAGKIQAERDEDNNCLSSTAAIQVTPRPDLVVTSVSVQNAPVTVAPGGAVTLTTVLANQGQGDADSSTTKFLLVDTTSGATKNLKGTQVVGVVPTGQSVSVDTTVNVYSDTLLGTYTVQACADYLDAVPEESDANNCASSSGTVNVVDPSTLKPDLVVTALTDPPAQAALGDSFAVTATVTNQGTAPIGTSTTKFYLVNASDGTRKNLNGTQSIGALQPGQSDGPPVTVAVYSDTVPATYVLQACADGGGDRFESDETNNCTNSTGRVTVLEPSTLKPDLVVTALTDPPAQAAPGDSFSVTATVTNDGTAPIAASTTKFYLANTADATRKNLNGTQSIGALQPGQSDGPQVTVAVYSDTVPGTYVLQACADGGGDLPESDETNNCTNSTGTVTVAVAARLTHDLVVTALTDPPATALPGDSFPVTATVKNQGTGAIGTSTTKFYLVNVADSSRKNLNGLQSVPALPAGESAAPSATVVLYSDTTPGTYRLQACADGDGNLSESDETNNCLNSAGTVSVSDGPDLVVVSIGVPPISAQLEKTFKLANTVKNVGVVRSGPTVTKFSLVSATTTVDLGGTQDVPPLDPGAIFSEQATLTIRDTTPLGSYHVQACANSNNAIEHDHTNNCKQSLGSIKVGPRSDLAMISITVKNAPVTVAPGGNITVTTVVKNQGGGSAAPTTTKLLLVNQATGATKNLKGTQSLTTIGPGVTRSTTTTLAVYSDTPPGTYVVRACADSAGKLAEDSELNNCADSTGTVTVQ